MKLSNTKFTFSKKNIPQNAIAFFYIAVTLFFIHNVQGQNSIDTSSWVAGNSATPSGYNNLGSSAQNSRVQVTGPFGNQVTVWDGTSDGSSGFNGGFIHDGISVNTSNTYRISYWLKASGPGGCFNRNRAGFISTNGMLRLDGSSTSAPEFVRTSLSNGDWILVVGYIHPNSYSGGTIGGAYNITTVNPNNPVSSESTEDFRFPSGASTSTIRLRAYMYNCASGNSQQIYAPRLEVVNGQEPSLSALLGGGQGGSDTTPPSAPVLSNITSFTHNSASLNWTASTDDTAISHYEVKANNGFATVNVGNTISHTAQGLNPNTTYNFTITAYDTSGNMAVSGAKSVTTSADPNSGGGGNSSDQVVFTHGTNVVTIGNENVQGNYSSDASVAEVTGANGGFLRIGATNADKKIFLSSTGFGQGLVFEGDDSFYFNTDGGLSGSIIRINGKNIDGGSVAIASDNVPTGYKLAVGGKVIAEEVRVELEGAWPDYVFSSGYHLPSLKEVAKYIKRKGHLPNVPSSEEVQKNGILLGNMNSLLLEKIEELTLYTLQQEEKIKQQEQEIKSLQMLKDRLAALEKMFKE